MKVPYPGIEAIEGLHKNTVTQLGDLRRATTALLSSTTTALVEAAVSEIRFYNQHKDDAVTFDTAMQTKVAPNLQGVASKVGDDMKALRDMQQALVSIRHSTRNMLTLIEEGSKEVAELPHHVVDLEDSGIKPTSQATSAATASADEISDAMERLPDFESMRRRVWEVAVRIRNASNPRRSWRPDDWSTFLPEVNATMTNFQAFMDRFVAVRHGLAGLQRVVKQVAEGKPVSDPDALKRAMGDTMQELAGGQQTLTGRVQDLQEFQQTLAAAARGARNTVVVDDLEPSLERMRQARQERRATNEALETWTVHVERTQAAPNELQITVPEDMRPDDIRVINLGSRPFHLTRVATPHPAFARDQTEDAFIQRILNETEDAFAGVAEEVDERESLEATADTIEETDLTSYVMVVTGHPEVFEEVVGRMYAVGPDDNYRALILDAADYLHWSVNRTLVCQVQRLRRDLGLRISSGDVTHRAPFDRWTNVDLGVQLDDGEGEMNVTAYIRPRLGDEGPETLMARRRRPSHSWRYPEDFDLEIDTPSGHVIVGSPARVMTQDRGILTMSRDRMGIPTDVAASMANWMSEEGVQINPNNDPEARARLIPRRVEGVQVTQTWVDEAVAEISGSRHMYRFGICHLDGTEVGVLEVWDTPDGAARAMSTIVWGNYRFEGFFRDTNDLQFIIRNEDTGNIAWSEEAQLSQDFETREHVLQVGEGEFFFALLPRETETPGTSLRFVAVEEQDGTSSPVGEDETEVRRDGQPDREATD
jgi:hypothetical protein